MSDKVLVKEKIIEATEEVAVEREQKIDAQGRAYATGKRKNANRENILYRVQDWSK